jgi:hypothetical protein
MIDISLFGTFLLWPLVLLAHLTRLEFIDYEHIRWILTGIALICALSETFSSRSSIETSFSFLSLAFNVLTIVVPFRYMSLASVASLLFVIPFPSGKRTVRSVGRRSSESFGRLFSDRSLRVESELFAVGHFRYSLFVRRCSSLDDSQTMVSSEGKRQDETRLGLVE